MDHEHRTRLRGDCERCVGLCCVAPAFATSADFAITKPAATPCPNLGEDHRCAIHTRLRAEGFAGCIAYDCFGAGQQVTQVTFAGPGWRGAPDRAAQMFRAFAVMSDLHELLWYLHEALAMPTAAGVHGEARRTVLEVEHLRDADAGTLGALDPAPLRRDVNDLLLRASELVRNAMPQPAARGREDLSRADLIAADLRGRDLRAATLFGARCIGADLTGADLSGADLRGADLRGAVVQGTDLSDALFLIQAQIESASGDAGTRLPSSVTRPAHWDGTAADDPRPSADTPAG